jgi:YD repeat-containing protein
MKKTFWCSLVILLMTSAAGHPGATDAEVPLGPGSLGADRLQGPVVRLETLSEGAPEVTEQGRVTNVRVYDERGNKVEERRYHEDGSLQTRLSFEFDRQGNLLMSSALVPEEALEFEEQYRYDEVGNRLEQSRYAISTLTRERVLREEHRHRYDEGGRRVETVHLGGDGQVVEIDTFAYDENGVLVERARHNGSGALRSKVVYRYDDDGKRVEEDHYHSDGTLRYTTVRLYDEGGNELEYAFYHADGTPAQMAVFDKDIGAMQVLFAARSRFDVNGNELEYVSVDLDGDPLLWRNRSYQDSGSSTETSLYGEDGEIESRRIERVDEYNNLLETVSYDPDGIVTDGWVQEYDYDSFGNWVRQVRYRMLDKTGKRLLKESTLYRNIRYNVPKTIVYTSPCKADSSPAILPVLTVSAPLPSACVRITPLRQIPPPSWEVSVIIEVTIPHPSIHTGTSAPQQVAIAPAVEIRPYPSLYKVLPGDSLWFIADMFRLSVEELKAINSLESDLIHPGQVLRTRR